MASTATRTKPAAKRKAAPKQGAVSNLNAPRWTDREVKILLDAVTSSPTAKAGIENAAGVLGKTVGTCSQKYYSLKRKENGGRKRTGRKAAAPATKRSASATRQPASRTAPAPRKPSIDVASMSNVELSKLVAVATTELQRRMVELEANVRKLLG